MNMGIAFEYLGRTDDARRNLENAISLADETGQARTKAYAMVSLAEILIKRGEPEAAKEHCFSALDILTDLQDPLGISGAYINLALAEDKCGNTDGVKEYCRESIAALDGVDVPEILEKRKVELDRLLREVGDANDGPAIAAREKKNV